MDIAAKRLNITAWLIATVVTALAVIVWGQSLDWHIVGISTYRLFPVFGLVAFSLMWSHYVVSVMRQYLKLDKAVVLTYFEVTSWIVLAAILLHPSLLIYQLFRDGLGLPPGSYEKAYGWVTLVGTFSLFAFLAYEFRRIYNKRPWWRYIEYLTDVAMLAIFYHGLRLGSQLQSGWFQYLWYFYGITLVGSLIYIYEKKLAARSKT